MASKDNVPGWDRVGKQCTWGNSERFNTLGHSTHVETRAPITLPENNDHNLPCMLNENVYERVANMLCAIFVRV